MDFTKSIIVPIKQSSEINEKCIQNLIAVDPSILGLGKLDFISKEKVVPGKGRLDLLLGDLDANVRYEVEIQLGKTDPSHIIRVLEYWDLERKRFPEYDHIAVIIAEDITSRFLNVISLFNGVIPIIALQMKLVEVGKNTTLFFTTILNQMALDGKREPRESNHLITRDEWESKTNKVIVSLADKILNVTNELVSPDNKAVLVYESKRILINSNVDEIIAYCFPKKTYMRLAIPLTRSTEIDALLENSGLDTMDYNSKLGRYRIRLTPNEKFNKNVISKLIQDSIAERSI
jgi:hypothetical protein